MEQSHLKEILNALTLHGEHIDKKMNELKVDLENRMDEGFKEVNKRFDNLGKKVDGIRVDLSETQETTDFLSSKVIQHEQKIRTTN